MLFNSIDFAIFLPVVFALYWMAAKKLTLQNSILLVASYFFYACWDWRFLFLLVFSTALDFYTGHRIDAAPSQKWRRFWLVLSVGVNLGFLGFFKYYNFFIGSFADALRMVGVEHSFFTLSIILPVGISFYTFHGLSYVFDIYNRKIIPCGSWLNYSLFVSFFPLLVAGPIERATHLLPQIEVRRKFDYAKAVDGLRQILWGLFKKMVIADNCARFADLIFENHATESGSMLLMGAVFFALQIYGDFSGYSDIALGTARLFGIELLQNFRFPYFSRDIAEFWRRWHISLTTWFRDYLYIPLGGSKGGTWMKIRNTFIIFLVSGLWHGANWTFVIWGLLNAIYFLPLLLSGANRTNLDVVGSGRWLPSVRETLEVFSTFLLTCLAWVFFRAESVSHAMSYLSGIFSPSLFTVPKLTNDGFMVLLAFFVVVEWIGRENRYALENMFHLRQRFLRWNFYALTLFLILFFMVTKETPFIYFQF